MGDTEYTKGFRSGVAYENERIVKLLEAEKYPHPADYKPTMLDNLIGIDEAIELIKGETNGN
jgi:hypothetical protein